MRERDGRTLPFVADAEDEAVPHVLQRVRPGSTIHADEASSWDSLHARYAMHRINHSIAYSDDGACTNQAESFFSRLHRAEIGIHYHISGRYLAAYAGEMAWREDYRRRANGDRLLMVTGATMAHPVTQHIIAADLGLNQGRVSEIATARSSATYRRLLSSSDWVARGSSAPRLLSTL